MCVCALTVIKLNSRNFITQFNPIGTHLQANVIVCETRIYSLGIIIGLRRKLQSKFQGLKQLHFAVLFIIVVSCGFKALILYC
jgi:hypothetical protein